MPPGLLLTMILRSCCLFSFLAIVGGATNALNNYRVIEVVTQVAACSSLCRRALPLCEIEGLAWARKRAGVMDVHRDIAAVVVVDHRLISGSPSISQLTTAELLVLLEAASTLRSSGDALATQPVVAGDVLSSVEVARLLHQDRRITELLAVLGTGSSVLHHRGRVGGGCSRRSLLACRESLALMILFRAARLVLAALIDWMVQQLLSILSIACDAVLLADYDVALMA